MLFQDRREAGRALARSLQKLAYDGSFLVLALPRGGVPVAYELAHALRAELDVAVVRKLGVPTQPELALGALGPNGDVIFNRSLLASLELDATSLAAIVQRERTELNRRLQLYRAGRGQLELSGRKLLLVDDGLATGATMFAACESVRLAKPAAVHIAAPVGAAETVQRLSKHADHIVCLHSPEPFGGVGRWYVDFQQTEDTEVLSLLAKIAQERLVDKTS